MMMIMRNERPALLLWLTTTLMLGGYDVVEARYSSTSRFRKHRALQSVCYACGGPDMMVTSLEATIDVPTQGEVTCAQIEMAGLNGLVEDALCGLLQEQASRACGCGDNPDYTEPPTPVDTDAPTSAPSMTMAGGTDEEVSHVPSDAPSLVPSSFQPSMNMMDMGGEPYICNVCGQEGWSISMPEAMVTIPTQGLTSCEQVVAGAAAGLVPDEATCGLLTGLVSGPCGCMEEGGDMGTPPPTVLEDEPAVDEDPVDIDPIVDDSANALVYSSLAGIVVTLIAAMA